MKKITHIFLLCIFANALLAQQSFSFSQTRAYQELLNPATINLDNKIFSMKMFNTARVSFRKQWSGINDAPETAIAQYYREFERLNMIGGITLLKDKTGPTSQTGGYLRYAYQIKLDEYSTISVGVAGGFYQFRYDGKESILRDANDIIGLEKRNNLVSDFKLGIYYSGILSDVDIIYGGLALPQVASLNISKDGTEDYAIHRARHLYANIGYIKFLNGVFEQLPNHSFIEPSLEAKYAINAPVQITSNIRIVFSGLFWVGTGYAMSFGNDNQSSDNLRMEVGVMLGENFGRDNQMIKISYGFDKTLADFGVQLGNSHEINLSYSF